MYRSDISCRYMLSSTARVVLGMIRLGKTTGYEIKQLVDVSARFFWSASYGQIYPELRRLEEARLVEAEDGARDGRQRRAYSLTAAGERALDEWLRAPGPPSFELRDEGMLKLFFSDSLTDAERAELLRSMRAFHETVIARLEAI